MRRKPSWRQVQTRSKWRSIVAAVITVVLVFAIVNGTGKSYQLKNKLGESKWDGKSTFLIAINSNNPSLFVYQREPQNLAIFTLDGQTFFETGKFDVPLEKFSNILNSTGEEFSAALSRTYGVDVGYFIKTREKVDMTEEKVQEMLTSFLSITTPLKILTVGYSDKLEHTNITRFDAFRLWWQLKGIRIDSLKFSDLTNHRAEIIDVNDQAVLGVDTVSLNRVIADYTENLEILNERESVEIVNGSENIDAAILATRFVKSVGGNVVNIKESELRNKTTIYANSKNNKTASYLANIFGCDINEAKNLEETEIMVNLGVDFTKKYFE